MAEAKAQGDVLAHPSWSASKQDRTPQVSTEISRKNETMREPALRKRRHDRQPVFRRGRLEREAEQVAE